MASLIYLCNRISKKSLLWPLKPKRRPKSHKKPTIWGSFYDLTHILSAKGRFFARNIHSFAEKMCDKLKSFLRSICVKIVLLSIMHNNLTQTEKIWGSQKSCKKSKLFDLLLGLTLAFLYDFWIIRCRISDMFSRHKKVFISKMTETSRL